MVCWPRFFRGQGVNLISLGEGKSALSAFGPLQTNRRGPRPVARHVHGAAGREKARSGAADLHVHGMVKNCSLARALSMTGRGMFRWMPAYHSAGGAIRGRDIRAASHILHETRAGSARSYAGRESLRPGQDPVVRAEACSPQRFLPAQLKSTWADLLPSRPRHRLHWRLPSSSPPLQCGPPKPHSHLPAA